MEALSLTHESVRVVDGEGRPLPARRSSRGRVVSVELVVTPALLADPPERVEVALVGGPSPHALRLLPDGRLGRTLRAGWSLRPELAAEGPGAPRLVSVGGHDVEAGLPRRLTVPEEGLALVYGGPLDPATVTPAACPLLPLAGGVALAPVEPAVDWRCVGQRFELLLRPGGPPRDLLLSLRRFGVRGPGGEEPQPAPEVELDAS